MKTVNFVNHIWVAGGETLVLRYVKHNLTAGDVYAQFSSINWGIGSTLEVKATGQGSNGERITLQEATFPYDTAQEYIDLQATIALWVEQQGVDRLQVDLYL